MQICVYIRAGTYMNNSGTVSVKTSVSTFSSRCRFVDTVFTACSGLINSKMSNLYSTLLVNLESKVFLIEFF